MLKKYHKVLKIESDQWLKDNQEKIKQSLLDKYRLKYHLMPPIGWLNDPNGLCQKDGIHHIYFQYCPFDSNGDLKTWGHVTTKDFINYQYHDIAIYPDNDLDKHGAYSGSAFIKDDLIYFFYTGNVKLFDRDDYDYINKGRLSNTIVTTSKDGFNFTKKQLILDNHDYPKNISNHIRDPKVFQNEGSYYMVLGARDINSQGCVVLYQSDDLKNWHYFSQITTEEKFGYMWECPDMFKLNNQWILLTCPQGVKNNGYDYANVHQTTIMYLDANFKTKQFKITKIEQLDRGFDFYAQQTYLDEHNHRIMIGWMGIPDASYTNPTVKNMWQHALTMPRKLILENGKLKQKPLSELKKLRKDSKKYTTNSFNQQKINNQVYELNIEMTSNDSMKLELKDSWELTYHQNILTLDISKVGSGRTKRSVKISNLKNIHLFSDTSSLEIFINDGDYVFTTRIYIENLNSYLQYTGDNNTKFTYYPLNGFNY